jgi:hypothetical protein
MTTPAIRTALLAEIAAQVSPLEVFNLSDYVSVNDLPVSTTERCLLVDFVASSDNMITIGGRGNQGWQEIGTVAIHWLVPMGFDSAPDLANAEVLRLALRGRRLGDVLIESVEPFADSGTPVLDSGWMGFSSLLSYSYHTCG